MAQGYSSLVDVASSWSDINVAITPYSSAVLTDADVSAISHSGTVEVGEQKKGGRVVATTTGSVKYEGKVKFYRGGLRRFVQALIEAAPDYAMRGNQVRIALIRFDIDIQHSPPGAAEISHHRMKGCRLIGYSDDMSEGNDADQIELPVYPIENVQIVGDKEVVLL